MKNLKISLIPLAIAILFSHIAVADNLTNNQFKAEEDKIDAVYKIDKANCDSLAGNANDICDAQARGKRNVSKADLETTNNPTKKAQYNLAVAKAEANYSVANQKCDDKAGNKKDICVKEAKAIEIHELANAETKLKYSKANAVANEKVNEAQNIANEKAADANSKASETKTDARIDASKEKRAADYAVAKEKCHSLAGIAKDKCVGNAKTHFDQ